MRCVSSTASILARRCGSDQWRQSLYGPLHRRAGVGLDLRAGILRFERALIVE